MTIALRPVHAHAYDSVEELHRTVLPAPLMRVLADVRVLTEDASLGQDAAADLAALKDVARRIAARLSAQEEFAAVALGELSTREVEILRHVSEGMSNKQISHMLRISESTVRNHLSRTFNKLHAANRTDAVIIAMRIGQLIL